MTARTLPSGSVKVVGVNGQISLGKQFTGPQVLVGEQAEGVCLIRTASVVPDNERWLHAPEAASDLQKALAWASQNPASEAQLDETLNRLSHAQ